MKSKATGCGSISTVFSSIVLLCVNSIIIIIIIIINNRKYWVDVQRGTVLTHGVIDPF